MPKGLQLSTPSLMVSKCVLREDQEQNKHMIFHPRQSFNTQLFSET